MSTQATSEVALPLGRDTQYYHVRINVPDLDKTLQWYEDKLGWLAAGQWGFPQHNVRFARVHAPGGLTLEFVEIQGSKPSPIAHGGVLDTGRQQGIVHVAFQVVDCDAAVTALAQRGVEMIEGAHDVAEAGVRHAFFHDLDGNILELAQPLKQEQTLNDQ